MQRVAIAVWLVALALATGPVLAQGDPVPIAYGQARSGSITAAGQVDTYSFTGAAGDVVIISLINTDPDGNMNFNPFLALYGPGGEQVASDDDSLGGFDARIVAQLPAEGTYTIEARVSDRGVKPTGNYTLTLEQLDAPRLAYNEAVTGTIQQDDEEVYYLFNGTAGDVIAVEMRAGEEYVAYAADNFDPALKLLGPGGLRLASDNSSGALADALLMVTLPEDGLYTIVATATDAPGPYTLWLGPAPLLEPGEPVVVPDLTWRTQGTFGVRAAVGQTIRLAVQTLDSSDAAFLPHVRIANEFDTYIAEATGPGLAMLEVTVPRPSYATSNDLYSDIYVVQVGNEDYESQGAVAIILEGVQ